MIIASKKWHLEWICALAVCGGLSLTSPAQARSRGISGVGCEGCHGGNENSTISLSPLSATPGQDTILKFTIHDPDAEVAGVFIDVNDTSGFSVSSGSQMALVSAGISHTSPRAFANGEVTYELNWAVPSTPGAVRFVVSSLAANGDGRSSGDEAEIEVFDVVYGCEPQLYYQDFDGDGYGRDESTLTHCVGAAPGGYAAAGGDCDDNTDTRHPNAEEYCNRKDDDCDDLVDEDALPVELYPDADGDGYYSYTERQSEDMQVGCVPYPGYADTPGDCEPDNPASNPGAEEVCDLYTDEDCDGRVDERVRPICGVGWCRRESYTCDIKDCTPGQPVEETCNFMDDDCDDEIDEGDLCPAGEECLAGQCRPAEIGSSSDGSGSSSPTAGAGASSSISEGGNSSSRKSGSNSGGCAFKIPAPLHPQLLLLLLTMGALLLRRRQSD